MTLLTPEENQGKVSLSSPAEQEDSEEDLLLPSPDLCLAPSSCATPGTRPSLQEDTPSIRPVLNSHEILSSLQRDSKSPSRFSVEAECESILSDYSELGGPLREIERDVHYLDREVLRSDHTSLLPDLPQEPQSVSRGSEESQEEFERRLRKINLLSLAQEFAQLRKLDSQVSALHFHQRQGGAFRHSPGCSRGSSLERSARQPSHSPHRPSPMAINPTQDNVSAAMATNSAAGGGGEDLPVNEARRRGSANSDDLPANMRPDRCRNSPRTGRSNKTSQPGGRRSEVGEGDFDVYNMESAVGGHLAWESLERQMEEEQQRLESSKNAREEIRRRLAMSTEEEVTPTSGTEDTPTESSALLASPRKSRLQTRLQGTQSGMQICFMNDDMCEDEEERVITATLDGEEDESEPAVPPPNHPCFPGEMKEFSTRQTKLQSEATLALAQASTMARMQLEVERQNKKKSPIADMVGLPSLGGGRKLRLARGKLHEMNVAQLQVLVNDLHSQIEVLNEDLVHLLIERDDLHMEQDSMLVDIEDLTSHCHDPKATNNNKNCANNNRPTSRFGRRK